MTGQEPAYLRAGAVVVYTFAFAPTSVTWLDEDSPWYPVQKAETELAIVRTYGSPEAIAHAQRNLELWRLSRQDMVLRRAVKGAVWYVAVVMVPIEGRRAIARAWKWTRARRSLDAG